MANYQLIEMGNNLWRIEEERVRCFLFVGTERALLVDSGMELEDVKGIVEGITSLPVMLVNTHTDPDHIVCNGQFDQVSMHPAEYAYYHRASRRTQGLQPLWEGDVIDLGDRRFEVVLIPGHTPGSIALLDSDNRILVAGDSVQDGTIYLFGPQRDLSAYLHSLEKLHTFSYLYDQVYPSHARCPVAADILPGLIEGVQKLRAGELTGEPFFPDNPSVQVYDLGPARILYDPEPGR